ncbi:sushi, von Willebrand factor type A, EGF and pentraxin domain-containing protein 1-like isoform X2 [Dermacentor albipictus]|uniref:sushi, von Willebrand factor type A, EGF and pentraxin domain-containing protein 1-like isoform X2 n=1 Tax=Dermacentor albipictus TaxID=60249 RepID=UPI0038FCA146
MRLTLFVAVAAGFCIGSARFLEDEHNEQSEQMCTEPEDMYIHHRVHQEKDYREKFPVGTRLTYRCGSGYIPRDIKTWNATCQVKDDGSVGWDIGKYDCRPVSCGHPGDVRWGRLLDAVFLFPRHVRYQCNKGYRMVGEANLYCQSDGTWNRAKPECHIVDCGPLYGIANGTVRLFGTQYGSKAEFTCNEGFKMVGTNTRTCDADGQWSDEYPRCEEIWCPPPEPPEGNGTTSLGPNPGTQRSGIRLQYFCPEKTFLQGSDINVCRETGSWLFDRPTCTRNCVVQADPSAVVLRRPNNWSNKMEEVLPGAEVTVSDSNLHVVCREGYEFVGTKKRHDPPLKSLRCRDGAWYPPSPWCREKPCRNLSVPGGEPDFLEVSHNEVVNFTCKKNYQLRRVQNGPYPVCRFGKVHGPLPTCKPVGCRFEDLLNRVKDGKPRPDQDVSHGSLAAYECETPFVLEDGGNLRCHFGTWRGQPPKCVPPKQCAVPDNADSKVLKDGWIKHRWFQSKLNPGTSVRNGDNYLNVECETGYHFRDESLRGRRQTKLYCNGGQWSPTAPWCTKIHPNEAPRDCEFPERANRFQAHNAHVRILVGNRVPHGTELRFHCEPVGEVLLQGSPISRCHDGQWTPEVPYCYGRESNLWNGISMHFLTESYTVPGGVVYLEPNSDVVLDCWSNVPVEIRLNTFEKAHIEKGGYAARAKFRLGNGEQTVVRCEKSYERTSFRSIPVRGHHVTLCPLIPTVQHLEKREVSRGSYEFYCQEGYHLQGQALIHCLVSGLWSDDFPTCVPRTETLSVSAATSEDDDTAKEMESTTPAAQENHVAKCTLPTNLTGTFYRKDEKGNYIKIDQDKVFGHEAVVYIFCDQGNQYEPWQCRHGEWSHERVCESSYPLAPHGTTHVRQQQGTASKPAGYVAVKPAQHSHVLTTSEAPHLRPSDDYNNRRAAAVHGVSSSHHLTRGRRINVSASAESVPMLQQKGVTSRMGPALISPNEPSRSGTCTHPTASGRCSDPGDRRGQALKGIRVGSVDTAAGVAHELRPTGPDSRKESATDAYSNANSNFSTSYSKQSADFPRQEENPKVPAQFGVLSSVSDRTIINSSVDVAAETPRPEGPSESSSIAAPNGCQVEHFYTLAPPRLAIVTNDGASMVPSNSTFWAFCDGDGSTLVGNSSAVTCLRNGSWFIPPQMKCIDACVDFDTGPKGPTVMGRKDAYELGDSITLSCASGTQLQPHVERIICLGHGWSEPAVPICVPVEEKREPKNQAEKKRRRSG